MLIVPDYCFHEASRGSLLFIWFLFFQAYAPHSSGQHVLEVWPTHHLPHRPVAGQRRRDLKRADGGRWRPAGVQGPKQTVASLPLSGPLHARASQPHHHRAPCWPGGEKPLQVRPTDNGSGEKFIDGHYINALYSFWNVMQAARKGRKETGN